MLFGAAQKPSALGECGPRAVFGSEFAITASVVPKHRQQDDDGDGNTQQPKESAATETHDILLRTWG
jgi:hypothetical protein